MQETTKIKVFIITILFLLLLIILITILDMRSLIYCKEKKKGKYINVDNTQNTFNSSPKYTNKLLKTP